jgi:hypothetical protein
MGGVLWTVWKGQDGEWTVAREGRWHERGARALWECFLGDGIDELGTPTPTEYRLVIDPPLAVQTLVVVRGDHNETAARLRRLTLGPHGGEILDALAKIHTSNGVLSALALRAGRVRVGALVLDALGPVIEASDDEELAARLEAGGEELEAARFTRQDPDESVSMAHLHGALLPIEVEALEPIDVPSRAASLRPVLQPTGLPARHVWVTAHGDLVSSGPGTSPLYRLASVFSADRQVYDVGSSEIVIGRSVECDLVLEDTGVSRRHARIVVGDGGTRIVDLGSANGTLVNGRRISGEVPLSHGDVIMLGRFVVSFERKRP